MQPPGSLFLLDPEIIFLNHGSFGATPKPVFESYQRWQLELEREPVDFLGRQSPALLGAARSILAEYVGTDPDNLVFVTNATTGLNIVARSLSLGPGDEVLSTDHEYGAVDRTWRFLAKKQGYKYINTRLPIPVTNPLELVEALWQAVTPNTRVISISHITSPTALIFPIEEICKRASQAGILTVVDGAHSPGQIPLHLDLIDADFYTGNLHKWLCAPKGSGFLFANPRVQHLLEPLIISWGWDSDHPGPSQFIDYLEWTGTRDLAAFLAVPDAIHFQDQHDWISIRKECHSLAIWTQNQISDITGLPSLHGGTSSWYAQMTSCPLPNGLDIVDLQTRLYAEFHIEVPLISWQDHNLIRVSFQAYNTTDHANTLINALKTIL